MEPHGLAVEIALRDQQVGTIGQSWHVFRPFAVTSVSNDLAGHPHAYRRWVGLLSVDCWIGRHLQRPEPVLYETFHVRIGYIEFRAHHVHAGHECTGNVNHSRRRILGPGDEERALSLRAKHGIHQQERHATAVIAMKMRQYNCIDRVVRNVEPVESNKTGGAEIDAETESRRIDKEACIEATTRAKRVAAADKR